MLRISVFEWARNAGLLLVRGFLSLALLCGLLALTGCSTVGYYWQSTVGHLQVLHKAKPVDEWLEQSGLDERLRLRLLLSKDIRRFASDELALPDNRSYTTYADLGRKFPVWSVTVASPLSLDLKPFCFVVLGCVNYKGFYKETDARYFAEAFRTAGLDVSVQGIPAYSTLGYTPDPLLNSFIFLPEGELARLVFHELAHQVVYIADDTRFNESFATAVEELGVERWLAQAQFSKFAEPYRVFDARRQVFRALIEQTRLDLSVLYAQANPNNQAELLKKKKERILALVTEYRRIRDLDWGGWPGYNRYFEEDLNNARLALGGLYTDWVPAFKRIYAHCGSNFQAFYSAVEKIGRQPATHRQKLMNGLSAVQDAYKNQLASVTCSPE